MCSYAEYRSKSRLRKLEELSLGPEYSGSQVGRNNHFDPAELSDDGPFASVKSRQNSPSVSSGSGQYADPEDVDLDMDKDIEQDDEFDSDRAFGDEDKAKFQGATFRGSKRIQIEYSNNGQASGPSKQDRVIEDADSADFSDLESEDIDVQNGMLDHYDGSLANANTGSDKGMEDAEMEYQDSLLSEGDASQLEASSLNTEDDSSPPLADDDRAALRKMMAESQKVITSNLSKAAKSDIAKGRAIKRQRTTFNSLLSTRIRLKEALIATNAMHDPSPPSTTIPNPAIQAAEQAALKLWSTLDSLRQSLHSTSSSSKSVPTPAQPLQPTPATPFSTLWTRMQSHETDIHPHRTSTLNKWSAKTAPPSSLPRANKFSAAPTQPPLSSILEQQLQSETNMQNLIAKSSVPRSFAPANPIDPTPIDSAEEVHVYDDTPFYTLLLRDLVSSQASDPSAPGNASILIAPAIPGIKDRVHKKKVDTKASKGRKIRYTVHEKLQNFMAADDRGTWGDRQREELVRGLLGRKVVDEAPNGHGMSEGEGSGEERAEEGLRLFR